MLFGSMEGIERQCNPMVSLKNKNKNHPVQNYWCNIKKSYTGYIVNPPEYIHHHLTYNLGG